MISNKKIHVSFLLKNFHLNIYIYYKLKKKFVCTVITYTNKRMLCIKMYDLRK